MKAISNIGPSWNYALSNTVTWTNFLFDIQKSKYFETYGSANLRVLFMDDKRGKNITTDTLFENLDYFWTLYHDPTKSLFWWYGQKLWKLEMTIRKKWNPKVLPLANIIFKKYREKDEFFYPTKFLEEFDNEERSIKWKCKQINKKKTFFAIKISFEGSMYVGN